LWINSKGKPRAGTNCFLLLKGKMITKHRGIIQVEVNDTELELSYGQSLDQFSKGKWKCVPHKRTPLENKYHPNWFASVFHTPLVMMFVYFRHKTTLPKLIAIKISHCSASEIIIPLCWKVNKYKVVPVLN
jgi:hypothetical protein